jgi:ribokinase
VTAPRTALFAGDVSLDTTVVIGHVPEPDEKVHSSALVEDVGGVVTNAAIACRRAGVPATLVVALGDDLAGQICRARLHEHGIEPHVATRRGITSRALIMLDGHGEKRLVLAAGVSLAPDERSCLDVDLVDASWLHTAAYDRAATIALVDRCRTTAIPWSLDLEPATLRDGLPPLRRCLDGAAAVFVNTRAAALLGPDPAGTLLAAGVRQVICTLGADGARLHAAAGAVLIAAPPSAEPVVDTTGAGDCLAGTYIAELCRGQDPADALRVAVTAASMSCRRLGGPASYARRDDVQNAMAATAPTAVGAAPSAESER